MLCAQTKECEVMPFDSGSTSVGGGSTSIRLLLRSAQKLYSRFRRSFAVRMDHLLDHASDLGTSFRMICDPLFGGLMFTRTWWPAASSAALPAPCSATDLLERHAVELEEAGNYVEAFKRLDESYAAGSKHAAMLAHELAQRHPEAVRGKSCPFGRERVRSSSIPSLFPAASADVTDSMQRESAGSLLSLRSPAATSGGTSLDRPRDKSEEASTSFTCDPGAALDADTDGGSTAGRKLGDDATAMHALATSPALNDSIHAPSESPRRCSPPRSPANGAAHGDGATLAFFDDGAGDGDESETAPDEGAPRDDENALPTTANDRKTGGVAPWERGWQAPREFKPPAPTHVDATAREPSTRVRESQDSKETSSAKRSVTVGSAAECRNFTVAQLNAFDGRIEESLGPGVAARAKRARPIYIALRGKVYDVSGGRHLYGPGRQYSELAGHDASRRVAKGLGAARREALDDLNLEDLGRFEEMTLTGWEDMFRARGYPVLGAVVAPPAPTLFSRAELREFDGSSQPPGYAAPPIYVGTKNKVFDVSFGGSEFYAKGGAYECLAGRDASRVLAKMSMAPEDVEGLLDYGNLTERESKNLEDWVAKLEDRGYPVVGWLDIASA